MPWWATPLPSCCARSAGYALAARCLSADHHFVRRARCARLPHPPPTTKSSPAAARFNIKAKSLRLGASKEETIALWQQHEAETGQMFDPAIWPELWADTEGQPWLVNALGYECTWEDRAARDRSTPSPSGATSGP